LEKKQLRVAKILCIVALSAITLYSFVRLYVMSQRADASVLLLNVFLFSAVGGLLIYLSKKERDLEKEEMFRD
jgi:hypothetical protein